VVAAVSIVPLLLLGLIIAAVVVFTRRRGQYATGYKLKIPSGGPTEQGGGLSMQVPGRAYTPTQSNYCEGCGFERSQGFADKFCPSCGMQV